MSALSQPRPSLLGRVVLVAHGDCFVGDYLASVIRNHGTKTVMAARSAEEAEAQLADAENIAVAAVAAILADGPAWEFARSLGRRGIPLVFLSAPAEPRAPSDLNEITTIWRPFAAYQVVDHMLDALEADARKRVIRSYRELAMASSGEAPEDEVGGRHAT